MTRNRRMFGRILAGSIRHRWRHVVVATVAVTLGAGMVSAAAIVASSVSEKMGRSLRAYGPNLLVVPRAGVGTGATLDQTDLAALERARSAGDLAGFAPFLYVVARVDGRPVAVAGTWFEATRKLSPWWQVDGAWVDDRRDTGRALIGVRLAEDLGLKVGGSLMLRYGDLARRLEISGVVTTGGPEDGQVLVTLAAAQALTGQAGRVSLVQASALPARLQAAADEIQAALPDAEAKTVRQVALAEAAVGARVELLLGLVGLLVLATASLGVTATQTTSVLERSREVGLMKALGAMERRIVKLFLAEGALIGLAGGVLGYGLGLAFATAVGRTVFATALTLRPWVVPVTVGTATAVTLLASLPPIHRAASAQPAEVLRGE